MAFFRQNYHTSWIQNVNCLEKKVIMFYFLQLKKKKIAYTDTFSISGQLESGRKTSALGVWSSSSLWAENKWNRKIRSKWLELTKPPKNENES